MIMSDVASCLSDWDEDEARPMVGKGVNGNEARNAAQETVFSPKEGFLKNADVFVTKEGHVNCDLIIDTDHDEKVNGVDVFSLHYQPFTSTLRNVFSCRERTIREF